MKIERALKIGTKKNKQLQPDIQGCMRSQKITNKKQISPNKYYASRVKGVLETNGSEVLFTQILFLRGFLDLLCPFKV